MGCSGNRPARPGRTPPPGSRPASCVPTGPGRRSAGIPGPRPLTAGKRSTVPGRCAGGRVEKQRASGTSTLTQVLIRNLQLWPASWQACSPRTTSTDLVVGLLPCSNLEICAITVGAGLPANTGEARASPPHLTSCNSTWPSLRAPGCSSSPSPTQPHVARRTGC